MERNIAFLINFFDDEMKSLQGGTFINELVSHHNAAMNSKAGHSERSLLMFSGHDTTISFVLNLLGVFNSLGGHKFTI